MAYMWFGTIRGFRHSRWSWTVFLQDKGDYGIIVILYLHGPS